MVDFKRSNSMINKMKGVKERSSRHILQMVIAIFVIIACTATTVAAGAKVYTTHVFADNELIKVVSFSTEVEDILNKANVVIGENDLVDMTYYAPEGENSLIYVYRACEVTIVDGKQKYFVNTAGSVEGALAMAGVKLDTGDTINFEMNKYVYDGMVIKVTRAFGVTIIADGKSKSYNVTKGTVAQALENAGVELGENDKINVKLNKKVKEGMKIIIERVTYDTHTETETLAYTTKTVEDSSMYKDQTKVLKEGKNGTKTVTYEDTYVDGELVESKVLKTKVKKEATERVVAKGTKSRPVVKVSGKKTMSEFTPPSDLKLDKNGRPTEYKKLITGKATAYCSGTTCSTGVKVKQGYVAVNPKQIPYGTKMYIVSSDGKWVYGYAIAADTGGFVTNGSGTTIDLYMYSYSDCINFGRRDVEIYIID